ncbi:MAG: prepilin-type N-terminal cleavage/methylation domain-containing protein [Oscillospiraceae bacterium]|nr:prepilin-type N-terminal cleavage/methylation domain-containing protein [Oscillospiraceae bacterium]
MKSMKNLKNKKGFTLIEILVVLALIGVSMGVVGISSSSTATNNLRKCTNAVNSMLARCRVNSLYRAEPVFVEFAVSGGNIVGRYFESDADGNSRMIEEQIMGSAKNLETIAIIDGEEINIRNQFIRVSFTRRGMLYLIDGEGNELEDALLTQIRFTSGTITYVIDITPETGSRRVRAG